MLNIASLILGQNGIWGEILKTSPEGTALFGELLAKYKLIKADLTLAFPLTYGSPGESVEIHEKINPETGAGAVVLFGNGNRTIEYITENQVASTFWHSENVRLKHDAKGRAVITVHIVGNDVGLLSFGVE